MTIIDDMHHEAIVRRARLRFVVQRMVEILSEHPEDYPLSGASERAFRMAVAEFDNPLTETGNA